MRLATVRIDDGTRAARLEGDELVLLPQPDAATALSVGAHDGDGPRVPLQEASLRPPTVAPRKVVCVGLNYASHIEEMGRDRPAHPTLFAKFARALTGPYDPIVLPRVSGQIDWEAELAAIVVREVRHASRAEARAAIGGYTVLNDVSVRDYQWRTTQWLSGKTFERSTPVGPFLVTPDEVDHAADLEIRCEVDGAIMQRGRTSDLVFDAAAIVAALSEVVTVEPGDLIATGTPGGVGAARDPQVFLRPGQVVRTVVEGLGELVNVCELEADGPDPAARDT